MRGPIYAGSPTKPASGKSANKKVKKTTGLIDPRTGKPVAAQPTVQDLINGARDAKFSNPVDQLQSTINLTTDGTLKFDPMGNLTNLDPSLTFQELPYSDSMFNNVRTNAPAYTLPETVRFNLPPHSSSLPMRPSEMGMGDYYGGGTSPHRLRRAIMWYYGSADVTTKAGVINSEGNTAAANADLKQITGVDKKGQPVYGDAAQYNTDQKDTSWGFQFLWNPETISTTTTRNSNVVPSNLDKFANQGSLFTAMEALNFTITIDRTMDFAYGKALYSRGADQLAAYYQNGYPGDTSETIDQKIDALMRRGTLADIEYIYRTINGSGQNGNMWLNGFGQETAELGFLSPTAVAVRFGPDSNSISYVGWVESLQVQHTKFTEDMVPITSVVSVMFNAFSRVSLTSNGLVGPNIQNWNP
jgi:hypothetical protein